MNNNVIKCYRITLTILYLYLCSIICYEVFNKYIVLIKYCAIVYLTILYKNYGKDYFMWYINICFIIIKKHFYR